MPPANDCKPAASAPALTDTGFRLIQAKAYEWFGLHITASKHALILSRLTKLADRLGLSGVPALIELYRHTPSDEAKQELFNSLSTNWTGFFRESVHFDLLRTRLLNPLTEQPAVSRPSLRFWSAGCSMGCEPYGLAMVLHEALDGLAGWDAKILATDLAVDELDKATRAEYPAEAAQNIPAAIQKRHIESLPAGGEATFRPRDHVRKVVSFAKLNLLHPWKMTGPFDAIFCRNVLIYFDDKTRRSVVERFVRLVRPGGYLFLGTSELAPTGMKGIQLIGPSAYEVRGQR
ncbi:MAG: protein-glutamate O-methyltransferase CheR [bacterium]|nr:protein-glutamate O-methyltransferase CheR [bacterium]